MPARHMLTINLVLKTLETLGAMHGYGIAQRIRRVSNEALTLNQGRCTPRSCGSKTAGGFGRRGRSPSTTGAPSSIG